MQRECFFTTAAKDEGVAALEPHDAKAGSRGRDHRALDRLLGDTRAAAALANVDAIGPLGERQHLRRDQPIVKHEIGFAQPPQEALGSALAVLIKARHLRPQVARSMPAEEQARALASVLDVGETLAASLLVALHLGDRRPLLTAFLDATGLPHEDGLLKEEADAVAFTEDNARAGVRALAAAFPRDQVEAYLNTLWLQDPDRWASLAHSSDWLD